MKLRALRLWNVRKFANRGVAVENIGDGVNVLSAENEFGKSTSFDALHALFFQPHSGTPKAVRSLRPYSGGSPQIEVDIETSDGLFRINKQYYGSRRAVVTELATRRVVAQADDAEAWIAARMRGGASGPAGLLWVQQGVTGIGGRSSREETEERKVREDALTSVTGDEVEMLTGGRRMIRVLDKTVSSLDALVTSSGKPRTGGPYDKAVIERGELLDEEKELEARLEKLRGALDSRRGKRLRLKEISEPDAARRRQRDRDDASSALEEANMHSDKLAKALAEKELAAEKHRMAAMKLDEYSQKLEKASRLAKKITDSEAGYKSALQERDEAMAADRRAENALEEADETLDSVRLKLEAAKKARIALEADARLKEVEKRLREAEKAQGEIAKLEAECEVLAVPERDLQELEKLERNIETLKEKLHAEAVTFRVEYIDEDSPGITCNGVRVSGGKLQEITASSVLEIPDIGRLSIFPGSGSSVGELQKSLGDAQNRIRERLDGLDLESVSSAKERAGLASDKSAALKIRKAELAVLAPEGIDDLRRLFAGLKLKAGAKQPEVPDIEDIEARAKEAVAVRKKVYFEREISRARLQSAMDAFIRTEAAINSMRDELARIEQELGSGEERAAFLARLQENLRRKGDRLSEAEKTAGELESKAPDPENAAAAFRRAASAVEKAGREMAELERDIAGLDGRIATYGDQGIEERYEELKGRRKAADARVEAFEREVAALLRLRRALEDARAEAKEQYFGPVMAELKPLLTLLLDEASIKFDEVSLLPQTLVRDGLDEDIGVLSGGMREQLAILTRLAFARLLARGGDSVPVILDDALVYSDDNRIEKMFDALHRQASDLQILVFTCRQRAFERLGGNGLRMTGWNPDD